MLRPQPMTPSDIHHPHARRGKRLRHEPRLHLIRPATPTRRPLQNLEAERPLCRSATKWCSLWCNIPIPTILEFPMVRIAASDAHEQMGQPHRLRRCCREAACTLPRWEFPPRYKAADQRPSLFRQHLRHPDDDPAEMEQTRGMQLAFAQMQSDCERVDAPATSAGARRWWPTTGV